MDKQNTSPFETALAAFEGLGDTSVWSLIVTLMGDRAGTGEVISGRDLGGILQLVGVKPEALRVALHRLRKDGWIASSKTGRTSEHRLTRFGIAETSVAAKRIYQQQLDIPTNWYLLLGSQEATRPPLDDALSLGRGIYLGSGVAPVLERYLVMQGSAPSIPKWLKTQLGWDELADSYARLKESLRIVSEALDVSVPLLPNQVAILRILIVHHWRRNLLKHPDLPIGFFPDGWRGEECRELVMTLLERLAFK